MHAQPWQVVLESALLGIGIGSAYSSLAKQVIDWVSPTHTSVAVGMNAIVRFTGGAFGAQVSAAVLASTVVATGYPTERGFEIAIAVAAVAAGIGAVVTMFGPSRRAQQSSPYSA